MDRPRSLGDQVSGLLDVLKSHLASLLLHSGVILAVVLLTTFAVHEPEDVIEVEIIESRAPEPPRPPEKRPEQPEPERPARVPEDVPMRKVEEEARAYHPRALDLNRLERRVPTAGDPSTALPPAFAISMEATVAGGDGIEVVAVGGDSANVLADPGRPGFHGPHDPSATHGIPAGELADSWEITEEPEPLNDASFRPVYPPEARVRRLESVVQVELMIDTTGTVAGARVVTSGGRQFSDSALDYCRRLRFKPARANQIAVASRIVWEVVYRFSN